MIKNLLATLSGVVLVCTGFSPQAAGETFVTPHKAAQLLFPDATQIKKENLLLTQQERETLQQRAQVKVADSIFTVYKATKGNQDIGYGGIFTSSVRTKDQTSMVALDRKGNLIGVEMIAFYEPPEYKPHKKWLNLFSGKTPGQEIVAGKDIPVVTGATLTTETIAETVRIIRALWLIRLKNNSNKGQP